MKKDSFAESFFQQRARSGYIDGIDPPPSFPVPPVVDGVEVGVEAGAGAGAGVLLVPGNTLWTVLPKLLARSFTCSTTRLMTLFFGAGFLAGAARLAAFFGAGRRAAVAFFAGAGLFEVFRAALEDFFAPPFLAGEVLAGAFFEAFFEVLRELFFEAAFFAGRRALLAAFFEDFLDEPFFDALFFALLREELFLDAAMLCLLLKCLAGAGLDQGITLRGNSVARSQFRRTCLDCHAR